MKYEQSHPWISFQFRLPNNDPILWLRLGELSSKFRHLAGVPLKPAIAEELHQIYLAKGVMATTAIEGNTLSEEQVLDEVRGDLSLPPSQEYLQQEVRNIVDLCNREIEQQLTWYLESPKLCSDLVKGYNRGVLRGLALEKGVVPGEVRDMSVIVGNVYRGAPAEDCEFLLDKLCNWLDGDDFKTSDDNLKFAFAVVKAVVAHVYLAWIHPFGDGNGRTARMLEFHVLFAAGVPLPAAHLLSDHYNRTRTRYYRELDRASRSGGDIIPFLHYAIEGFIDGIREQIERVRIQQMEVAWENFVHELFRGENSSPAQKRRRDLALVLRSDRFTKVADIPRLSVDLAAEYANTERTVQRDVAALHKKGLITKERGRVRARKELIEAFLPKRVESSDSRPEGQLI